MYIANIPFRTTVVLAPHKIAVATLHTFIRELELSVAASSVYCIQLHCRRACSAGYFSARDHPSRGDHNVSMRLTKCLRHNSRNTNAAKRRHTWYIFSSTRQSFHWGSISATYNSSTTVQVTLHAVARATGRGGCFVNNSTKKTKTKNGRILRPRFHLCWLHYRNTSNG